MIKSKTIFLFALVLHAFPMFSMEDNAMRSFFLRMQKEREQELAALKVSDRTAISEAIKKVIAECPKSGEVPFVPWTIEHSPSVLYPDPFNMFPIDMSGPAPTEYRIRDYPGYTFAYLPRYMGTTE